jgi:hypothetical protein
LRNTSPRFSIFLQQVKASIKQPVLRHAFARRAFDARLLTFLRQLTIL